MPNSFGAYPKLLSEEYYYEYSEPHRRRPTIFEFPAFTIHTATYFSKEGPAALNARSGRSDESKFEELLQVFLGWTTWSRTPHRASRNPGRQIDITFIRSFARFLQAEGGPGQFPDRLFGAKPQLPRMEDEVLSFECAREPNSPIAIRVEVHREYFSLTLFYHLEFEALEKEVTVLAPALSACCPALSVTLGRDQIDIERGVLDVVFGEVRERLLQYVNAESMCLFGNIERLFPECTFANFHGCTLPAALVCGPAIAPPLLSDHSDVELQKQCFAPTQQFLVALWPQLRRVLFAPGTDDVTACYMQRGHAIYVSSLGAQSGPRELDDLRYVLFYNDGGDSDKPASTGFDWQSPRRQRSWRISRLVFRLHEAGTLRLAALRKLRRLRQAMHDLTLVEQHVAKKAWPSYLGLDFGHHVRRATEKLFGISADLGEPVEYRLSRSSYYFRRAKAHINEVGDVKIPGWQSYHEFLQRRVYLTYEQISGIGGRIDRVLQFIQTQNDALRSARSLLWQFVAALATLVVLPPYVGDVFERLKISAFGFEPWRLGFLIGFGSLVAIAAGFTLKWLIGTAVRRANRARASGVEGDEYDASF